MNSSTFLLLFLVFLLNFSIYHGFRSQFPSFSSLKSSSDFRLSIRPSLYDVERMAQGKEMCDGTKSRRIHHRLRANDLQEFKDAKERRYLKLPSLGWHPDRYEVNPLVHTFRLYCDCLAIPMIKILKAFGKRDSVIIDFATLRSMEFGAMMNHSIEIAKSFSSLYSICDQTDVIASGLLDVETPFQKYPIWKVQEMTIIMEFERRSDGENFAKEIAKQYCFPIPDSKALQRQQEKLLPPPLRRRIFPSARHPFL